MACEKYWANEKTTEVYINLILLRYIEQRRSHHSLNNNQPELVVIDRFKGQYTENF